MTLGAEGFIDAALNADLISSDSAARRNGSTTGAAPEVGGEESLGMTGGAASLARTRL